MKRSFRRILLFMAALWLYLGICPLAVHYLPSGLFAASAPPTEAEPAPDVSAESPEARTDTFLIYDESSGETITVSDREFLPLALLCEMSPDAPDEALKAQTAAIHTTYSRMRAQNTGSGADFTCNTETRRIYAPENSFKEQYGTEWETIYTRISSLCSEVQGKLLYYGGELITAPYFAVSAGCTQPSENVWGGQSYPYLQAIACPTDLLFDGCQTSVSFSPEDIRTAFPDAAYTDDPAKWFAAPVLFDTGYVQSLSLCGTILTGTEVREALSLRSAAFSVAFDGERFTFTTLGWGHGVGMSQAGAVYMAENGANCTEILSFFYPGTTLQ